jgi:hypothetical protein
MGQGMVGFTILIKEFLNVLDGLQLLVTTCKWSFTKKHLGENLSKGDGTICKQNNIS